MNRSKFLKLSALFPLAGMYAAEALAEEVRAKPLNAWPEGSELSENYVASASGSPLLGQRSIEIGFKNAIRGYEMVYPTLAAAVKNMSPMFSTRIDWPNGYNFSQIVRTPLMITNTEFASRRYGQSKLLAKVRTEALHDHLKAVEQTLAYGRRSEHWKGQIHTSYGNDGEKRVIRSLPYHTCGGMNQLGPGKPYLRVLRDLQLLPNRQELDIDAYKEEFLSEFSLEIR